MTDAPKIERPPLEEWRLSAWPLSKTVAVIDYALALEAKLARYERYREQTKDFWHMTAFGIELSSDDIAKEEGIE